MPTPFQQQQPPSRVEQEQQPMQYMRQNRINPIMNPYATKAPPQPQLQPQNNVAVVEVDDPTHDLDIAAIIANQLQQDGLDDMDFTEEEWKVIEGLDVG